VIKEYSPEVLLLRNRVRLGNIKVWSFLVQIRDVPSVEDKARLYKEFSAAQEKLKGLNAELKSAGYEECLYIDANGKKVVNCLHNHESPLWECIACPGGNKYWETELFTPPALPKDIDSREPPKGARIG
jgi:hypothetical protein